MKNINKYWACVAGDSLVKAAILINWPGLMRAGISSCEGGPFYLSIWVCQEMYVKSNVMTCHDVVSLS